MRNAPNACPLRGHPQQTAVKHLPHAVNGSAREDVTRRQQRCHPRGGLRWKKRPHPGPNTDRRPPHQTLTTPEPTANRSIPATELLPTTRQATPTTEPVPPAVNISKKRPHPANPTHPATRPASPTRRPRLSPDALNSSHQ